MRIWIFPTAVAALTVASLAVAHSWDKSSVIGVIQPGTVHCGDKECTATVRAEHVTGLESGRSFTPGEIDVTFDLERAPVFGDRLHTETWTDARAALSAMSGARVRLLGDLDGVRRPKLFHLVRAVRTSAVAPSSSASLPLLFTACGQPPWSQQTLKRCFAPDRAAQQVTVRATLESDAYTDKPTLTWAIVLDLDDVSVEAGAGAVAPPAQHETALVKGSLHFLDPSGKRVLPSKLRAGDRVTLGGAFEMPAPHEATNPGAWTCDDTACWPRLVVDRVTVAAANPAKR
jgi:hypothetical protein